MTVFAYDASTVLAFLFSETGADLVEEHLGDGGTISSLNASEVILRQLRNGHTFEEAREGFEGLHLFVMPFDREAAYRAAALEPMTRSLGLSLADRACLVAARTAELPVITTDTAWSRLAAADVGVEIVLAR